MNKIFLVAVLALAISACSSNSKSNEPYIKSQPKDAVVAATPVPLTSEAMVQKYSLLELNAAANALKVVVDASLDDASADKGQEILGCSLTGQKAMSLTMPIRALIDQKVRSETDEYEQDPKGYADSRGFDSCAANCSCGVLSDVVEAARASGLPRGSAVAHSRSRTRLGAKAKRQAPEDSMTCARKATWLCASDLKAYLDKE